MISKIKGVGIIFISLLAYLPTQVLSADAPEKKGMSFKEIFLKNQKNISDKWENYLDIYNEVFQKFRDQSPTVLEIGVQNGGNLLNFQEFFKNAQVYGIDIDPNVCKMDLGKNIKTFCFSAADKKRVEEALKDVQFDVILDDGSHMNAEVIETFRIFFQKLKPGGVYLIEDLHTSYWETPYKGGYLRKTSSIEFLKKFVDLLNYYTIQDPKFRENISAQDHYMIKWLESITFYDSVAVIKKLKSPKKKAYKRMVAGKFHPVYPIIDDAKKEGYYYSE